MGYSFRVQMDQGGQIGEMIKKNLTPPRYVINIFHYNQFKDQAGRENESNIKQRTCYYQCSRDRTILATPVAGGKSQTTRPDNEPLT